MFSNNILIFVISIFLLCGTTGATISYFEPYDAILIDDLDGSFNLQDIETAVGDSSKVWHSGTVWNINASLYIQDTSHVWINDSEATVLNVAGNRGDDGTKMVYTSKDKGIFHIDGVTINGYNFTTDEGQMAGVIRLYDAEISNATVTNSTGMELYDSVIGDLVTNVTVKHSGKLTFFDIKDTTITEISIPHGRLDNVGYDGIEFQDCERLIVDDVDVNYTSQGSVNSEAIYFNNCSYTTATNIHQDMSGSFGSDGTSAQGIQFTSGDHNTITGFSVNSTGYGGFGAAGSEDNLTAINGTVRNWSHNGIDLHPAKHSYFENITVIDGGYGNNFMITAGTYNGNPCENVTFVNITSISERGSSIIIDTDVNNITFINPTMDYSGMSVRDAIDVVVRGGTYLNNTGHFETWSDFNFQELNDIKPQGFVLTDASINQIDSERIIEPHFMNVEYNNIYNKRNVSMFYYPNVIIKDTNGDAIEDATVSFTEQSSGIYAANKFGNDQTHFITDAGGMFTANDYSQIPSIAEFGYDSDGVVKTDFVWDISVSKSGYATNSITGIEPDATWYSSDLNNLNGTEIVITLTSVYVPGSSDIWGGNDPVDLWLQLGAMIALGAVVFVSGVVIAVTKFNKPIPMNELSAVAIGGLILVVLFGLIAFIGSTFAGM